MIWSVSGAGVVRTHGNILEGNHFGKKVPKCFHFISVRDTDIMQFKEIVPQGKYKHISHMQWVGIILCIRPANKRQCYSHLSLPRRIHKMIPERVESLKCTFQKYIRALKSENKIVSFNVGLRYFVWDFKGSLRNSTQTILPIHWNMCCWLKGENSRAPRLTSSQAFFKWSLGNGVSQKPYQSCHSASFPKWNWGNILGYHGNYS